MWTESHWSICAGRHSCFFISDPITGKSLLEGGEDEADG